MKTRNLLLGMACMAAFTACSNNEEPVMPAAQTRTVTINVSTGADTRTSLVADGEGLKRTFASTDKLSILFKDDANDKEVLEIFDLKSGAGTTSATFEKTDSQLPATGTTKVLVWVDPRNRRGKAFDATVQYGELSNNELGCIGTNEWLVKETTVTDGVFTDLSLESKSIFLKIPAETKLVNNVTGEQAYKMSVLNDNIVTRYDFSTDNDGFVYKIGGYKYVNIKNIALKDGALVNDCYIAMMTRGDITSLTIKLDVNDTSSFAATNNEITVKSFSKPLEFGHIYNIQQGDLTLAE